VAAILLAAMVAIVSADVLGRYILDRPIQGAGELATMLFVWQVFLAGAAAVRRRMHIGIEFIVDRFPTRLRAFADMVVNLAVLVMMLIVVWMGWGFALQSHFKQLQMLGLPYTMVNMAVPFGCALMSVHLIGHIIRAARGVKIGAFQPPRSMFERARESTRDQETQTTGD
jgi:TRAP-type C4-dicarboxylate transport system permease small subunit